MKLAQFKFPPVVKLDQLYDFFCTSGKNSLELIKPSNKNKERLVSKTVKLSLKI